MSLNVSGIGGMVTVGPPPIKANNPPASNFPGKLGQDYFDYSTTPPTLYIFNGTSWVTSNSSGTFTTLTVNGTTTLTGLTNINTTGAAITNIGTGGTGAVNIGNVTGGTTFTGPMTATTIAAQSETLNATAASPTTGLAISTFAGTGVGETIVTSGATIDALQLTSGGIKFTVAAPAPGASPITANSRNGVVTFSGASIAAGATQAFVINNSIVTSATHVMAVLTGGTTGSALTVQSVVSGTGIITITVQNGVTGSTTSTGNLTFVFIVLD